MTAGEQVRVLPAADGSRPVADRGEVVRYWRNGYWIVREALTGATVAYAADRLVTL